MADPILRQFSFTAGEISQEIEGKLDSSKRQQALRRLLNAYITFGGTLQKRPGLQLAVVNERGVPDNPDPGVNYASRLVRWAGSRNEPDLLMVISAYEIGLGGDECRHDAVFSFMTADRMRITENLGFEYVPVLSIGGGDASYYSGYWLMRHTTGRLVIVSPETAPEDIASGHFTFRGVFPGDTTYPTAQNTTFHAIEDLQEHVTTHPGGGTQVDLAGKQFLATSIGSTPGRRILYNIEVDGAGDVYAEAGAFPYTSGPASNQSTQQVIDDRQAARDYYLVEINRLFEVRSPYLWEHVRHSEDDFDEEADASEPGLKFAQSSDVMTITHPGYPAHIMERSADDRWRLSQTMFDFDQKAPTGLYIRNYRPRSPNEGFDPNRAEGRPVDFAVTAYNDTVGESRFGAALTDTRFLAPENSPGEIIAARTDGTTWAQAFAGFEVSQHNPGLFVRIALYDNQDEDDIKDLFPPGTAVYFSQTLGTRGLEQRVFQVREFRGSIAKGEDDRVTHFSAVSGSAVADLENTGWRGPWLVLEPAPPAKTFENIYARKVGNGQGLDEIGDRSPPEDADDTNPYNIGATQVPE